MRDQLNLLDIKGVVVSKVDASSSAAEKRIQAGEQLASAMEVHKEALGEVYVETIRAAEKSGNLPKVLEHLTDMLEKGQEQVRMVRQIIEGLGRSIATPDEARQILSLKGGDKVAF